MPELRDYIFAYWRQKWMILSFVVAATGAAVITASVQPARTGVSESFAINRINRVDSSEYQYDGYYALQATDLFAQTVTSWFSTPSVLQEVYQRAGVDPESKTVSSLTARFKVKKYSAQNIVVRFTERTEERARSVAMALGEVMERKTATLNQTAEGKAIFEIVGTVPLVAPTRPNAWVWGGAALVLSFGFALLLAALRHYLSLTPTPSPDANRH